MPEQMTLEQRLPKQFYQKKIVSRASVVRAKDALRIQRIFLKTK